MSQVLTDHEQVDHGPVADFVALLQVQNLQVGTTGDESIEIILAKRLFLGWHPDGLQS